MIADYTGLAGIEAVTIEAACASGGAAMRVAYQAVAGGIHDAVAVCGVERMTHVERDEVTRALATAADWELEGVCGESFLSLNAALMRAYMDKYGVTAERFAPFAITAHQNALTNPNALLHKALDLETYLESRIVTDPIRLFDVSPVCNGAAAVILAAPTSRRRLRAASRCASRARRSRRRRWRSRGDADPLEFTAVASSTHQALKQAGVGHDDVDLFEPHDAYTIMTALTLEAAGFARPGAGLDYADSARIGLHGELPLATFGGLKARGHPVGASGCYQVVEAFLQLTRPRRRESGPRRRRRARAEHRRHGRHRREPRADARGLAAAQLPNLRLRASGSIATTLGRGAASPPSGQWLCGFVAEPASPGCCNVRNSAPPSAVNSQPQTSAPIGAAHELPHLAALGAVRRAGEAAVVVVAGLIAVRDDPQVAVGVESQIVGIRERAQLVDGRGAAEVRDVRGKRARVLGRQCGHELLPRSGRRRAEKSPSGTRSQPRRRAAR